MFLAFLFACSSEEISVQKSLVPWPVKVEKKKGEFNISNEYKIIYPGNNQQYLSDFLINYLNEHFHIKLAAEKGQNTKKNSITLVLDKELPEILDEGYQLQAKNGKISIRATDNAGLFYGIQTFFQLIPSSADSVISIPNIEITDNPRYSYRGMQLDVVNHFFDKDFVKKHIDVFAFHKMNMLYLHLFDNAGWRLESESYPALTKTTAQQVDEEKKGQPASVFFTKDDMREIIEYARQRHVTIIPEINFPGRALSVIEAYPHLGCNIHKKLKSGAHDISIPLCLGNDSVMIFYENIIAEIAELFPSPWLAVGGNMVNYDYWKACDACMNKKNQFNLNSFKALKHRYNREIEKIILAHGKKLITTMAFAEADLASEAMVVNWQPEKIKSGEIDKKHKIIWNNIRRFGFQHYQAYPDFEPPAFKPAVQLYDVYSARPAKDFNKKSLEMVHGLQGALWTQKINSKEMFEYMLLPRLCALSEVAWTKEKHLNWERFFSGLLNHYYQLDKFNVNYFIPMPEGCADDILFEGGTKSIWLSSPTEAAIIRYTLDDTEPTEESPVYSRPIKISGSSVIKAKTFLPNGKSSGTIVARYAEEPIKEGLKDLVNLYPGVRYEYFEGKFTSVNALNDINPVSKGAMKKIMWPEERRQDMFALSFSGLFFIKKEGVYTFYLTSDDGSKLTIDNYLLINNDNVHETIKKIGRIGLKAGYHAYELKYFEYENIDSLVLEFDGPGMQKQKLPEEILYYQKN